MILDVTWTRASVYVFELGLGGGLELLRGHRLTSRIIATTHRTVRLAQQAVRYIVRRIHLHAPDT